MSTADAGNPDELRKIVPVQPDEGTQATAAPAGGSEDNDESADNGDGSSRRRRGRRGGRRRRRGAGGENSADLDSLGGDEAGDEEPGHAVIATSSQPEFDFDDQEGEPATVADTPAPRRSSTAQQTPAQPRQRRASAAESAAAGEATDATFGSVPASAAAAAPASPDEVQPAPAQARATAPAVAQAPATASVEAPAMVSDQPAEAPEAAQPDTPADAASTAADGTPAPKAARPAPAPAAPAGPAVGNSGSLFFSADADTPSSVTRHLFDPVPAPRQQLQPAERAPRPSPARVADNDEADPGTPDEGERSA